MCILDTGCCGRWVKPRGSQKHSLKPAQDIIKLPWKVQHLTILRFRKKLLLIKASCLFIYKPTEDCFNMKHCVLDLSTKNVLITLCTLYYKIMFNCISHWDLHSVLITVLIMDMIVLVHFKFFRRLLLEDFFKQSGLYVCERFGGLQAGELSHRGRKASGGKI